MVNAQEWLDENYPKEERNEIWEIYLNEASLEGGLDLSDFTYYYGIKIYIFPFLGETKSILKNLPKKVKVIELNQAQEYIEKQHPTKKEREKIKILNISNLRRDKNLVGQLDLSDFVNLEHFDCKHNLLTNLILSSIPTNLKTLNLISNNFLTQNLSFLTPCTNLVKLSLGNNNPSRFNRGIYNKFIGSLNYLSGMKKLKWLYIDNTDLNEVDVNKLPRSLEKIKFSTRARMNFKLVEIAPQLEKFRYGWCKKCQQPNTGEFRCQTLPGKGMTRRYKEFNRSRGI